jgi:transcriptional regulator with XRE-family HTH domain
VAPEDIKTLRKELDCTAKELAGALGIEQAMVFAWERGERFPTKRYVDRMLALRAAGPLAVPKSPKPPARVLASPPSSPRGQSPDLMKALADPTLWEIVRKLVAHPPMRDEVARLAARYPDPASPSSPSEARTAPSIPAVGASGHSDGTGASPEGVASADPSGAVTEGGG